VRRESGTNQWEDRKRPTGPAGGRGSGWLAFHSFGQQSITWLAEGRRDDDPRGKYSPRDLMGGREEEALRARRRLLSGRRVHPIRRPEDGQEGGGGARAPQQSVERGGNAEAGLRVRDESDENAHKVRRHVLPRPPIQLKAVLVDRHSAGV
jgi:hypothetical protein